MQKRYGWLRGWVTVVSKREIILPYQMHVSNHLSTIHSVSLVIQLYCFSNMKYHLESWFRRGYIDFGVPKL
jgi:hypothetical protein